MITWFPHNYHFDPLRPVQCNFKIVFSKIHWRIPSTNCFFQLTFIYVYVCTVPYKYKMLIIVPFLYPVCICPLKKQCLKCKNWILGGTVALTFLKSNWRFLVCACPKVKSNFLCKNYASFNSKGLVGMLFVHCRFLKSPHPTLHTYLENKCGEYVEDNDDGGEVEGDKVEPHPPAAHGHHEPFGDHVPLVHHQQVKEYNQMKIMVRRVESGVDRENCRS